MSKFRNKSDKKENVSTGFQLESKNLQYTITVKDKEIKTLRDIVRAQGEFIVKLQSDIFNLKGVCISNFKLEKRLKSFEAQNELYEKEVDKLNKVILDNYKKFNDEKSQLRLYHEAELNQMKLANDTYAQKIELVNQLEYDKKELTDTVEVLKKQNELIKQQNEIELQNKEARNQIKFSNLKKKMMDNISETQSKVTELNIQYMDVSTKLTLLQNHQLLVQLEYQSHQLDDVRKKKEELEKKLIDLTRDSKIHREVELNLAEKNKNLKNENERLKKRLEKKERNDRFSINNLNTGDNSKYFKTINSSIVSNNNKSNNENSKNEGSNIITTNEADNNNNNNINNIINPNININKIKDFNLILQSNIKANQSQSIDINSDSNSVNRIEPNNNLKRLIPLEKKVIDLEKKLTLKKRDFNALKDKNEYTENILKNYEKKYNGLFCYFEKCLKNFFDDDELRKNTLIYLKLDKIKNCDFSCLNKEEQYSVLLILMKYLMPLISSNDNDKSNNENQFLNNINLRFDVLKPNQIKKKPLDYSRSTKIIKKKAYINNTENDAHNISKENDNNKLLSPITITSIESLPVIQKRNK